MVGCERGQRGDGQRLVAARRRRRDGGGAAGRPGFVCVRPASRYEARAGERGDCAAVRGDTVPRDGPDGHRRSPESAARHGPVVWSQGRRRSAGGRRREGQLCNDVDVGTAAPWPAAGASWNPSVGKAQAAALRAAAPRRVRGRRYDHLRRLPLHGHFHAGHGASGRPVQAGAGLRMALPPGRVQSLGGLCITTRGKARPWRLAIPKVCSPSAEIRPVAPRDGLDL